MDHPLKSRLLPLLTLLLVLFVVFALHPLGDDNRDYSEVIDQSGTGVLNLPRRSSASPASSEELTNLTRREDYTCAAGRPCSNGACCGESGFCGYGSTYCGTGCTSNCNAHAECGKDSLPAGKTCSMNVCCSEFGFCGTTTDFCTGKCQSNCVEHPSPPGGSPTGQVLSRVVGYYESWNSNSACRKTSPADLPLDALTHVNYAFTFLDPNTYQMTPMDSSTSAQLFDETTDLKGLKPGLQVWASLGGWTFSDNGTATQPLLGSIARDATKRQQFANNVLNFLETYAFDGIDIDWEYPGAPDRGGQPDDTANFVSLLQTLRNTFNNSPRKLGISFTIPASYWYLRWFDVPGLLQYADFTNLMSYDIHGIWDKENALGSIIRPHTNLTEVQLAVELLWRVGVPPNRISVGFGFYGRSFTLSDPSCTTPGQCSFSNGGAPGGCTDTSGYLAYYEIQDIIAKNPGIVIHHDEAAAIKYMSWDNNQWISYDDADTFKQKVDWANNIGFSGSLIWASDLDDNSMSAHKALLGRDIQSNAAVAQVSAEQFNVLSMDTDYGTHCSRAGSCVDLDSPNLCGAGEVSVGFDRSDCKGNQALPICCKAAAAPKSCTWRGGGLDCNGQCHQGEINLFSSRKGGGPASESGEKKCNRGSKMFCCVDEDFNSEVDTCYWTDCGGDCASGEVQAATLSPLGRCSHDYDSGNRLCCKTNPPALQNCHWVGKGDCADNTCNEHEVTVLTDSRGDGTFSCNWWRQKSLCCTPNRDLSEFVCTKQYCDLYPDSCPADEYEDPNPPDDEDDPEDLTRRDLVDWLDKRGERRGVNVNVQDAITGIWILWRLLAARYPGPSTLYRGRNGAVSYENAVRPQTGTCSTTNIEMVPASQGRLPNPYGQPERYENDHPIELQYFADFVETVIGGILPDGNTLGNGVPTIRGDVLEDYWNGDGTAIPFGTLPRPAPNAPTVWDRLNLNDRLYTILGSNYNRRPFRMLAGAMNNMKGHIYGGDSPIDAVRLTNYVRDAIATGQNEENFLQPLRQVIAIFRYLFDQDVLPQIQRQRRQIRRQLNAVALAIPQLGPLLNIWLQFDPVYFTAVADRTRTWLQGQITRIRTMYLAANPAPGNRARVLNELTLLQNQLNIIQGFPDPGNDQPDD